MEKGKERRCLIRHYIGWSRRQLLKLKIVTPNRTTPQNVGEVTKFGKS